MRITHRTLKSVPAALAILAVAGVLLLAQPVQAALIEGFESTSWPAAPWVSVSGATGSTSTAAAHDGARGFINNGTWYRRTAGPTVGAPGSTMSQWFRRSTSSTGRAYMCWDATASGAKCFVAAPNTSTILFQNNPGFGFSDIASTPFSWTVGAWYKMEVAFNSPTSVTGRIYASNGTTLLGTLNATYPAFSPAGFVATRSFGTTLHTDTIEGGTTTDMNLTSFTPTTGATNPTDCCRTESFSGTFTGTFPISYSITIIPPAGGSGTSVPPGVTSNGSFSFTATLCAGTNVPAAGKSFGIQIAASNASGNTTFYPTYALRDTTPPIFAGGGSELFCVWPPNHNWMSASIGTGPGQVNPSGRATDNCTVSASLAYIFALPISDEPANGTGDGDTEIDTGLSPDGKTVFFRSERSGGGDGRQYDIQVAARDMAGNAGAGSVGFVSVPHDSSEDKDCVDSTKVGEK